MKEIFKRGSSTMVSGGGNHFGLMVLDQPKRSYVARIRIYMKEMYPFRYVAMGALYFMSMWCGITTLPMAANGEQPWPWAAVLVGAITVALLPLLLRIMDELKDLDTDLLHFPERPVPRGDVRPSDLKIFGLFLVALLLLINLFFAKRSTMFMMVLAYAFLMYRYFFWKSRISRNILLALLTHQPVFFLVFLYVVDLYRNHVAPGIHLRQVFMLGVVFLCFSLSWEVSRKIRHPEQETAYQTYSMVMGMGKALLIPVGLSGLSLAALFLLYGRAFSSLAFALIFLVFLVQALTFFRFSRREPVPISLRSVTELFILTVQTVMVIQGV